MKSKDRMKSWNKCVAGIRKKREISLQNERKVHGEREESTNGIHGS